MVAGPGCSAIKYQSLSPSLRPGALDGKKDQGGGDDDFYADADAKGANEGTEIEFFIDNLLVPIYIYLPSRW